MISTCISVEEIQNLIDTKGCAVVKYIQLAGEYRFNFPETLISHADMVEKDEYPISAGFFSVTKNRLKVQDAFSSTLELGPSEDDESNLKAVFGIF